jgi:acetyl-CoA C-acetyltransferase
MREVAIVGAVRTPVGRFLGALAPLSAADLGAIAIRALVARTGIDPARIDDVILGHGYPSGEEPALGRLCALKADLPIEVPGCQVDRRCGSGLQAVLNAAMMVQSGVADAVIAGGAESMSRVEFYTTDMRGGSRMGSVTLHDRLVRARAMASPDERFGPISGMIETAENLARQYQIPREEQDRYSVRSHQRAVAAIAAGKFDQEVVPVSVAQRRGEPTVVTADEGPRAETSVETLAKLKPIEKGGTVTAGNASSQNDAAAVCLVVASDRLAELGVEPLAFLRGWAVAGCHPATMGIGPVPAVAKLFARTGLGWNDIDLIELNEAFAAQVLSVLKEWRLPDEERLNVNGSGISLGHPIAATGARILATMVHELRRRGARYGLETMCIGGGQGLAAVFERA